ncbi:hypothetical protein [Halobacillus dabanensis]|nr:hypothetical protein [Halobacillus dabanensis]
MVKTTKHITCSVAISSLIVGTSSQFVGKTLGAFNDSDVATSQIQACEVFPGYINELFSDVKEELLLFNNEVKNIPEVTSYTSSFERIAGLSEYSLQQLKEEEKLLKDKLTKLEKLQNDRLQLDKSLDIEKENLKERAHTIYKLFVRIAQLSDQTTASCLQDQYPLAGDTLKDLMVKSGLNHKQIEKLLFYYNTNQFGQNASPAIGTAIWEDFQASINEIFTSPKKQLEKNNQTMKEEKKKIEEEIASLQAIIKQLEKEEKEKIAKEKAEKEEEEKLKEAKEKAEKEKEEQKEAEEQKAKKDQGEQQDSQKETSDDSSEEKEESKEDDGPENKQVSKEENKEDKSSNDKSSSSNEQTSEKGTDESKDKKKVDEPEEKKDSQGKHSSSAESTKNNKDQSSKNDGEEGNSSGQGQDTSKEKKTKTSKEGDS